MEHLWSLLSMLALAGLSLFLILIVLLQRGRGGGLAGAFGGAGGSSALGTRAGDVFTKITVGLALVWILLACVNTFILRGESRRYVAAATDTPDAALVPAGEAGDADAVSPSALNLDGDDPFATPEPGGTAEPDAEVGADAFAPPAGEEADADATDEAGEERATDDLEDAAESGE